MVIKSRFVLLKRAGKQSVATHLRYIEREGVTRDGARGHAYGPAADAVDLKAFEERGRGDRHQFRMIVSVEDAELLQDLRDFTRQLMQRMSVDLETPLDWIAVDHWDTDNPHTHVVLRGRTGDGRDLVIAPEYMAHGMRSRASEIATEWLGPRTDLEIQQGMQKDVDQERLTTLDRMLVQRSNEHVVCVAGLPGGAMGRQLQGRLMKLQAMGLARQTGSGQWELANGMQETLRKLGERGDIVRAMHNALRGRTRELQHDPDLKLPVVGAVLDKGIGDELNDRAFLVVDSVDGRANYIRLPSGTNLSDFPVGGVVQVKQRHMAPDRQPGAGQVFVRLESHLSLEQQVLARGATWLDRLLVQGGADLASVGFGAQSRDAMRRRAIELERRGFALQQNGKLIFRPQLLRSLEEADVKAGGIALAGQLQKEYVHKSVGMRVSGTVRDSVVLDSGRYAIIESARSFSLIPLQGGIEPYRGHEVLGTFGDGRLFLQRGLGR